MANYRNGRKLISVTVQPELYARIKDVCETTDVPVSVWARQALEREVRKHATQEIV